HGGKGGNQDVVERLAFGELFAELPSTGPQCLVGEGGNLAFEGVDGIDAGLVPLDPPVIGGAEKLAGERADHTVFLFSRLTRCSRNVVHPTLPYQLTVTRRRAIPGLRGPSAERVGIKQFWGQRQKTQQNKRYHRLHDGAEIWGGGWLVNGGRLSASCQG